MPEEAPYECRWPWKRRSLNTHDYHGTGPEVILADIQAILENALGKLNPPIARGTYYVGQVVEVLVAVDRKLTDYTGSNTRSRWSSLIMLTSNTLKPCPRCCSSIWVLDRWGYYRYVWHTLTETFMPPLEPFMILAASGLRHVRSGSL